MKNEINIISGGISIDERGKVSFINDFKFEKVKRFYQVENFSKATIRAFHGHLKEEKYVYVVSGSIMLAVVCLDNVDSPSKDNTVNKIILSSSKPQVVHIPSGHANGFKVLEKETKIIFFSTSTLEESKKDDYRYPYDYWGKDIWKVKNH